MKAQGSHKQVKKIAKSARQRGLTVAGRDWKEELRKRVEKKQRKERMAKDEKKAREDKKVREGNLVEWSGQKKGEDDEGFRSRYAAYQDDRRILGLR